MQKFSDRLAEARTEKNISRASLAAQVGLSEQTLYNWESGIASPTTAKSRECVKLIAERLGVTETWLTAGIGIKSLEEHRAAVEKREAEQKFREVKTVNRKDQRQLEDIELVIHHLRDMNLSSDEIKAIHLTLSEIRADLECKVLFS